MFSSFSEMEYLTQAVFKSFYEKDLYFTLKYIVKFDSSILFKVNIYPKDFTTAAMLINLYLIAYKYHGLLCKSEMKFLSEKAKEFNVSAKIKDIDLMLDFLWEIDQTNAEYKDILSEIKKRFLKFIRFVRVDVLYEKLEKTDDFSLVLLFAKHKAILPLDYKEKFEKHLEKTGFFSKCVKETKYFECLYYLYDSSNKDRIFALINSSLICTSKIALLTDKIMGLNLENGLIYASPNLPCVMRKAVMNLSLCGKNINIIAKRGYDNYFINGKRYKKPTKVLLKAKSVEIVSSSC